MWYLNIFPSGGLFIKLIFPDLVRLGTHQPEWFQICIWNFCVFAIPHMFHNMFLILQQINSCFIANKPGNMVLGYSVLHCDTLLQRVMLTESLYFISKDETAVIFRGILLFYYRAKPSKTSQTILKNINYSTRGSYLHFAKYCLNQLL